jgi:hypothetical protein
MKKEIYSKAIDWIKYKSKEYFVDSTAMMVASTPIAALMEKTIAGMSDEVSINARLLAAGLTYAGVGEIFSKGRDSWRNLFKISDITSEKKQQVMDSLYACTFNLATSPLFYYAAGSRNIKEILVGTGIGLGLGFCMGGPVGYAIDLSRDLTGIGQSERIPSLIKKQNEKIKKSLFALTIAASLAITSGIYYFTPNQNGKQVITQETSIRTDFNKNLENLVVENKK